MMYQRMWDVPDHSFKFPHCSAHSRHEFLLMSIGNKSIILNDKPMCCWL